MATGRKRHGYVVADGQIGDAGSDFLDDACAFVAENHREGAGEIAVNYCEVGVAQAGRDDLDENFGWLQIVEHNIFEGERGVGAPDDCGVSGGGHERAFLVSPFRWASRCDAAAGDAITLRFFRQLSINRDEIVESSSVVRDFAATVLVGGEPVRFGELSAYAVR
jgi:hypothetical protein